MPFLKDFAAAVENYCNDSVVLQITDASPINANSPNVNTGDVFSFRVRIVNNGHLKMTGVRVTIQGKNGTKVSLSSGANAAWQNSVATNNPGIDIAAHDAGKTGPIYFKAGSPTQQSVPLVEANIRDFNVTLDDILNGHSVGSSNPVGIHQAQVFPV